MMSECIDTEDLLYDGELGDAPKTRELCLTRDIGIEKYISDVACRKHQ